MAEGNSLADALVSLVDTFQSAAMPHQFFHQNSQALRKEFNIPIIFNMGPSKTDYQNVQIVKCFQKHPLLLE